jgi:predicted alpha/beta-fold hydrolase
VICGISLGGNVLLKWLGELGAQRPRQLRAAVAASVPYDLEACSRYMEHGFARVYVNHFVRSLRAKTLVKLERYPDLCDRQALLRARTFWEFDDAVTGPVHGFAGAHDYYARSSSLQVLAKIRVPALLMSARDDPFLPPEVLERVRQIARSTDQLFIEHSARGGHVGWIEGGAWRPRYHMDERAVSWLASMMP